MVTANTSLTKRRHNEKKSSFASFGSQRKKMSRQTMRNNGLAEFVVTLMKGGWNKADTLKATETKFELSANQVRSGLHEYINRVGNLHGNITDPNEVEAFLGKMEK